jgi:hypothetical protein
MIKASDGRRSRVWVAAVAAVAALLLSGTVAVVNIGNDRSKPNYNPTVDVIGGEAPLVQKHMDLCWQTAKRLSGTVTYPDRATWRAVMAAESSMSSVTVIRANGQPLFCEINMSGVTLSNPAGMPAYVPGTRTGLLMSTFAGTVAGVVDPSWDQVHLAANTRYGDHLAAEATVRDGLFVYSTFTSMVNETIRVGPTTNPNLDLPKPPRQYGSSSPQINSGNHGYGQPGQLLNNCIQSATEAVPDADTWNPGAAISAGNTNLILAVSGAGVSTCLLRAGHAEFKPYLTMQAYTQVPISLPMPTVDGRTVIGGLLPPGVQRMALTLPDKTVVKADPKEDTFAALLPPGADPPPTSVTCELMGNSNQVLYSGPLT